VFLATTIAAAVSLAARLPHQRSPAYQHAAPHPELHSLYPPTSGSLLLSARPLTADNQRVPVALLLHLCNLRCCPSRFMQGLRHRDIFRFCAIPQIMSIGTLALLYNNGKVFEGKPQGQNGLELSVTRVDSVWPRAAATHARLLEAVHNHAS